MPRRSGVEAGASERFNSAATEPARLGAQLLIDPKMAVSQRLLIEQSIASIGVVGSANTFEFEGGDADARSSSD